MLNRLLERKGRPDLGGWRDAIAAGLSAEDLEWLTERFERTVASESLQEALDLPWSAVFTSSVDPVLLRRLETRGRQPEAITSSEHYPRAPRSTARPPVHYLFGRSNDVAEASRPPRTLNDLTRRLARHSGVLLSRLPETVPPAGLLVIEGYHPNHDWLPLESLLGAVPADGGMRVLWLGIDDVTLASTLFAELTASGSVFSDPRSLAVVLGAMQALGDFAPDTVRLRHEPGVISLSNGAFVEIDPSLRLRVEASAAIVDDDWTKPPVPLSVEAEEDLFRRSHGNPGSTRALVEAVARGFYITRSFEDALHNHVSNPLTKQTSRDRVIVLHGQSA